MEENKKFEVEFADNKLQMSLDTNQDGEKLMKASVYLSEAIQEALQRKDSVAIEGAKVVSFDYNLTKMVVKIDTDKDGEPLMELEIDLAEALDETGLLKK